MPETKFDKKPERVAAGLKAVVHNNNLSQEARNSAAERLRKMGVDPDEKLSARKAPQEAAAVEAPMKPTGAASRPAVRSQVEDSIDVFDSTEIYKHYATGDYRASPADSFMSPEAKLHVEEFLETHIHED